MVAGWGRTMFAHFCWCCWLFCRINILIILVSHRVVSMASLRLLIMILLGLDRLCNKIQHWYHLLLRQRSMTWRTIIAQNKPYSVLSSAIETLLNRMMNNDQNISLLCIEANELKWSIPFSISVKIIIRYRHRVFSCSLTFICAIPIPLSLPWLKKEEYVVNNNGRELSFSPCCYEWNFDFLHPLSRYQSVRTMLTVCH